MTPELWLRLTLGGIALAVFGIFFKVAAEAASRRFLKWLGLLSDAAENARRTRGAIKGLRREIRERDAMLHGRVNHAGYVGRVNSAVLNHHGVRLDHVEGAVRKLGGELPPVPSLVIPARESDGNDSDGGQ